LVIFLTYLSKLSKMHTYPASELSYGGVMHLPSWKHVNTRTPLLKLSIH